MWFNSRRRIIWLFLFSWLLALLLTGNSSIARAENLDQPPTATKSESHREVTPLYLYQKTISRADGDRCPMYPSDSHYAQQAFKRHGAIVGWVLALDRLLRCGHDETRLSPQIRVRGHIRTYDPLEANTFWWDKR